MIFCAWNGEKCFLAGSGSVVNDRGVTAEQVFCFMIQKMGNLMDQVFAGTSGAAEANLTTAALDFEFLFALGTVHKILC
jgi:hypothetical protein